MRQREIERERRRKRGAIFLYTCDPFLFVILKYAVDMRPFTKRTLYKELRDQYYLSRDCFSIK